MNCKYCHLNTHTIDKCPTIICKTCKAVGHPQWLCKESTVVIQKSTKVVEENKKKTKNENNYKNISYYLKIKNQDWSELTDN
jgi:hypothetical protein